MSLHSLEQRFLYAQTAYTLKRGQQAQLEKQNQEAQVGQVQATTLITRYQQAQELLLAASATARSVAQAKIEELVTLALCAITGDPYQFKLELVQSAGQWTVRFLVVNPAGVELDPGSCGGGIIDICSMALRIAILEMYEPRIEGPILLDENFKFLSREHIRTAIDLMKTLCEKTGRQIILVTHVPELAAGADRTLEVQPAGETSLILEAESPI
jgi:DNA repair exonuclease SbcCD ATPase subunit